MKILDSHAHYDDARFSGEYPGGYEKAIEDSLSNGICGIVNVGSSLKTSESSLSLASRYGFVYATVGIHPFDAQLVEPGRIDLELYRLESLASHEKVVAIGEIGLDYHYDEIDKDRQRYFFESQIEIAARNNLPVVIHTREAMGDTVDILLSHDGCFGVLHSFSGSPEIASKMLEKGWFLSYSGPVTYKNAVKVKESARITPLDRLLLETDSPYLPPVPFRGTINYSGLLPYICDSVASIKDISPETVAKASIDNACRLFKIPYSSLVL